MNTPATDSSVKISTPSSSKSIFSSFSSLKLAANPSVKNTQPEGTPETTDIPATTNTYVDITAAKNVTEDANVFYNKNLRSIQSSATVKNSFFDTVPGKIQVSDTTNSRIKGLEKQLEKQLGVDVNKPKPVQFISLDSIEENDIPTRWSIVNAASFVARRFKIMKTKQDFSVSGAMHQGISFGIGSMGNSTFNDIIKRLKDDSFINKGENDNIAYFMSRHDATGDKFTYIIWKLLIRNPITGSRDSVSIEGQSDQCYVAAPLSYSTTNDDKFIRFKEKDMKHVFFTAQDLLMCIFLERHTSEINSGGRKSRRSKRTIKSKRLGKTRRRR